MNAKCDELERKLYDRTEMLKIEISRRDVQVKTVREEMNRLEESKRDTEARVCVTLLTIIQFRQSSIWVCCEYVFWDYNSLVVKTLPDASVVVTIFTEIRVILSSSRKRYFPGLE